MIFLKLMFIALPISYFATFFILTWKVILLVKATDSGQSDNIIKLYRKVLFSALLPCIAIGITVLTGRSDFVAHLMIGIILFLAGVIMVLNFLGKANPIQETKLDYALEIFALFTNFLSIIIGAFFVIAVLNA